MSPDPLGGDITNPQSLNRYAYVLNNPTTLTDPLGLQGDNNHCTIANGCREPGVFPPPAGGPPGGYPGLSCTVDGISVGCGSAFQLLNAGSGGTTVTNSGGFLNFQVPIPPGAVQSTLVDPATGQPIGSSPGAFYPGSFETVSVALPGGPTFSWWGTFAKSFVTNFPKTTLSSLTSSNGCVNQFFSNTLSNLNPFTPSASSLAEPAANIISALKFNSALAYAASRPNLLGGTGLLYPFKSGVFRSLVNSGQGVLEATPMIQLDLALGQAIYSEYQAAKAGECQ